MLCVCVCVSDCVFVWIATHHFIIQNTHTHTHTERSGDYRSPYYGCTDNCRAPTGLPIHCNPSNTLNFHFKQRLNRQKTQGSILSPPLFCACFSYISFSRRPHFHPRPRLPSSRSNHLCPPQPPLPHTPPPPPPPICEIQYQNEGWCRRRRRKEKKKVRFNQDWNSTCWMFTIWTISTIAAARWPLRRGGKISRGGWSKRMAGVGGDALHSWVLQREKKTPPHLVFDTCEHNASLTWCFTCRVSVTANLRQTFKLFFINWSQRRELGCESEKKMTEEAVSGPEMYQTYPLTGIFIPQVFKNWVKIGGGLVKQQRVWQKNVLAWRLITVWYVTIVWYNRFQSPH